MTKGTTFLGPLRGLSRVDALSPYMEASWPRSEECTKADLCRQCSGLHTRVPSTGTEVKPIRNAEICTQLSDTKEDCKSSSTFNTLMAGLRPTACTLTQHTSRHESGESRQYNAERRCLLRIDPQIQWSRAATAVEGGLKGML